MLLRRNALRRSLAGAAALDALHVSLRRAVVCVAETAATVAKEPARAATGRSVFTAAPIERVVHRLASQSRVVADLVSRVSASAELAADRIAHLRDDLVVRQ